MLPEIKLRKKELGVWWLGQSGFYFLTPEGTKLIIDPYLTDRVRRLFGARFGRKIPVPVEPKDLDPDIFLLTHDHVDHLDEQTIQPVPGKNKITFIGPRGVARHLKKMKVDSKNIVRIDAGERTKVKGIEIEAVFAMPTDAGTFDTIGFIITFKNKLKIYITGDTSYTPFLEYLKTFKIDYMFTVINGAFNNMNEVEAAKVTSLIKPKTVIPMHFGSLKLDTSDLGKFTKNMRKMDKKVKIIIPELMKPIVLTKGS